MTMCMIALKSITQEIVNCWLGYVLSQPVDIDIVILVYFLANYVGLTHIQTVVDKLRSAQGMYFGESMDVIYNR